MKKLICALILLLCTSPLLAKSEYGIGKKDKMGVCNSDARGSQYIITNTSVADSCDASIAVGTEIAFCVCKEEAGIYAWTTLATYVGAGGAATDLECADCIGGTEIDESALVLTDYALLAGDADGQTIQGVTGENKARVTLTGGNAALWGDGELAGNVWANDTEAGMLSPDEGSALVVSNGRVKVMTSQTPPTNANDTCTAGDFIPTSGFIYFCVADDTWQRVAIATWP